MYEKRILSEHDSPEIVAWVIEFAVSTPAEKKFFINVANTHKLNGEWYQFGNRAYFRLSSPLEKYGTLRHLLSKNNIPLLVAYSNVKMIFSSLERVNSIDSPMFVYWRSEHQSI